MAPRERTQVVSHTVRWACVGGAKCWTMLCVYSSPVGRMLSDGIQGISHSVDLSRPCFRQGHLQMRYEFIEELGDARQVNRQQDLGQHAPQDFDHMPRSFRVRSRRRNLTRRLGPVARSTPRMLRGESRTRSPRAFEAVDGVSASRRSMSRSCTATCWAACPARSWICHA